MISTSPFEPNQPPSDLGFADRHIGPDPAEIDAMLAVVGVTSLDELVDQAVPAAIRDQGGLALPPPLDEPEALAELAELASRNRVMTSLIGMGYYGTHTPAVIRRNVLENPAWYTAYTPYQPEISQGRLEALLNFQTMISDLTGLDIANASLLDEATAAAEAMTMARRLSKVADSHFFVHRDVHPQTLAVLRTRAEPIGIELVVGEAEALDGEAVACFGGLLSYPTSTGLVTDWTETIDRLHALGAIAVVATDLLACTLLRPPGELGADIAVGSAQRFGVPMGFGGPHAGFIAVRESAARALPGRLVGVSTDAAGRPALRLALQTREQHIRREKATSNICTAQVLLANIAGLYGAWHGPQGLRRIAERVHGMATALASHLSERGLAVRHAALFDTVVIDDVDVESVVAAFEARDINVRRVGSTAIGMSLDETTSPVTLGIVAEVLTHAPLAAMSGHSSSAIPETLQRRSECMTQAVFRQHRSEHKMLRYLRRLADRDLALDRTMIPLGSCTMKLNATSEMEPITWPEFAGIHPYAPPDQVAGYLEMIDQLERALCAITGYDAVSLQPNAGSQGEFAGLLAIRAYHRSRGQHQRTVCLIPSSAHGTNAASAVMAGLDVVVVRCDDDGNIDLSDVRAQVDRAGDRLAAIMATYPSTHGVFEAGIAEMCEIVHAGGGQVYIDGANLNALVGLAQPGAFGADVSHLNLHKTFCIPHGGGGPGVGPTAVRSHLAPFLPGDPLDDGEQSVGAVAAARYGSAGILPIPWMYVRLMGAAGLRRATEVAILTANYVAARLDSAFPVLYTGAHGRVAHECILDLREITKRTGVTVDDVAKRLIDFGFHAPTMSFPVAGTLMVEPTESEDLAELDRFCEAMLAIRAEIDAIAEGSVDVEGSALRLAPHTAADLLGAWERPYAREHAAFPGDDRLRVDKYFPPVSRIDGAHGDRNLVCNCAPLEAYAGDAGAIA